MNKVGHVIWHKRETDPLKKADCVVSQVETLDENVLLERVVDEIEVGIESLLYTVRDLFGGRLINTSTDRMKKQFLPVVRYGVYGVIPKHKINDYTMQQFLINARVNGEFTHGSCTEYCEHIFNMAHSRNKIDTLNDQNNFEFEGITNWVAFPDPNYLAIEELALLARMHEQSVKNEIYGKKSILRTVHLDGYGSHPFVPVELASKWLDTKASYQPSRHESLGAGLVRVPVAGDGTLFGPQCKMQQGYKIGAKGEEEYVDDIHEALKKLTVMRTPRWRRPNGKGNYGIVSGRTWKTLKKTVWLGKVKLTVV